MTLVPRASVDVKICLVVSGHVPAAINLSSYSSVETATGSRVSMVQKDQEQEQANKVAWAEAGPEIPHQPTSAPPLQVHRPCADHPSFPVSQSLLDGTSLLCVRKGHLASSPQT